jgi:hypothetical protein
MNASNGKGLRERELIIYLSIIFRKYRYWWERERGRAKKKNRNGNTE